MTPPDFVCESILQVICPRAAAFALLTLWAVVVYLFPILLDIPFRFLVRWDPLYRGGVQCEVQHCHVTGRHDGHCRVVYQSECIESLFISLFPSVKSFLTNFVARGAPATHPVLNAHGALLLYALVALFGRRQNTALLQPFLATITLLHPHMRALAFRAQAAEAVILAVVELAHDLRKLLVFLDLACWGGRGRVHVWGGT